MKKEISGYYFENENNTLINGISDWNIIHLYRIENGWGYCIDKSMTKKTFKSFKEAKEYFKERGIC